MSDTVPCIKCGGEGQLVCRHNIYTMEGELYTVDCEDCHNSTSNEYATAAQAVDIWNAQNKTS